MYNKYTGQLETYNVIHDYIENENKILNRLTDEKIQRHYIQEIERLNNIIDELDTLISVKIIRVANEFDYQIDINDIVEIKTKLLELKENKE